MGVAGDGGDPFTGGTREREVPVNGATMNIMAIVSRRNEARPAPRRAVRNERASSREPCLDAIRRTERIHSQRSRGHTLNNFQLDTPCVRVGEHHLPVSGGFQLWNGTKQSGQAAVEAARSSSAAP